MRFSTPIVLALSLSACRITVPTEGAPATPQRPTFSSNTQTTAEDTVEVEAGLLVDWRDYYDTPTTFKFGATPSTEFFVGVSPFQKIDTDGRKGESFGDTVVGVRQRVHEVADGDVATALQLSTKIPTADESEQIGSGEVDFFAAGIVDVRGAGLGWTGFYQLGLLGEPGGQDVDVQHLATVATGIPVDEEITAFGELALLWTPEYSEELAFLTVGTAYQPRPSFVLDAAVQFGIGSDAPELALLVGFTQNLGRALARSLP